MKNMFRIIAMFLIVVASYAKVVSLDQEHIKLSLKNNNINLFVFPFVVHKAKLLSADPDDFKVIAENTSLLVIPSAKLLKETANIVVWTADGQPYLISVDAAGKKDQKFVFVSNTYKKHTPLEAKKFETGRIEKDLTHLLKKAVLGKTIPGYEFVKVKRIFYTHDLMLQKDSFQDGGKYRVETWYVKNITPYNIVLDYANFYTPGILLISFEKKILKPGNIGKMWLIIDKSTVADRIKNH